ncbi:MAG TPA: endonuclease, partial [Thioalkalivibrio sp.]|nr:endonuclease [Thioalkalivibrio sp.]
QGCWNRLRLAQAQRLVEWLASVRRDDAPVIIAGDVNAYAAEEPAAWLRRMGKRDLGAPFLEPSGRYTYVFQGQAGTLDSLLGPDTLGPRVLDAGIWHVNADEPAFLGYAGQRPAPGPWRASDHDPVWIDLTPAH